MAGGAGAPADPAPAGAAPNGASAGAQQSPEAIAQGILQMGSIVEQVLTAFAQAMPDSAKDFDQANEMIKSAIARGMQAQGMSPAGSPAAPGAGPKTGQQFPGGGMTGSGGGAGI